MTLAEFNIRLFSYKRLERNKSILVREIAWAATIGSHLDPKKLPKTKEKFMPIGNDIRLSKEHQERINQTMLKAVQDYNNNKKK
jgi:hypothetical protein